MKVAIIGFKSSGKTTIFNTLTGIGEGRDGEKQEYTIGIIKVPDERLEALAGIFEPQKKTPSEVVFVDFPGLPASKNILNSQIVEKLRNSDAIVHVVDAFNPENDPMDDILKVQSEMLLNDMVIIERNIEKMKKENRRDQEFQTLETVYSALSEEIPLRKKEFNETDVKILSKYGLTTTKPMIILFNTAENNYATLDLSAFKATEDKYLIRFLKISGTIEYEISRLPEEEQKPFLEEMNILVPVRDRFIRESFDMMSLIPFFTVGKDEVRSWTIKKGDTALKAASKIHSDIAKGFIRAEVINYDTFIKTKSLVEAKKKGEVRLEGKEYQVANGDIINFRFNV